MIEEKRDRIRDIDKQICDLLSERAEVAKELAEIKQRRGINTTDRDQEEVVVQRAKDWISDSVESVDFHATKIFRSIIEFTKTQMRE